MSVSNKVDRTTSALFTPGLICAAYLLLGAPAIQPESNFMSQEISSSQGMNTGFSYSPELAQKFGLPGSDAIPLQSPLMGAAIEIKPGIAGEICLLHVLYDAGIDIRLPEAQTMQALGSNIDVFPNGFLVRPDKATRGFFAAQVGVLSNRAIFRHGKAVLEGETIAGEDIHGSYTSMPLHGYNREFVPGVGWLAMSINCELAAHEGYRYATLYVESNDSPGDLIMNGRIDPASMIEFQIPQALMHGMRSALREAAETSAGNLGGSRFSVIK